MTDNEDGWLGIVYGRQVDGIVLVALSRAIRPDRVANGTHSTVQFMIDARTEVIRRPFRAPGRHLGLNPKEIIIGIEDRGTLTRG